MEPSSRRAHSRSAANVPWTQGQAGSEVLVLLTALGYSGSPESVAHRDLINSRLRVLLSTPCAAHVQLPRSPPGFGALKAGAGKATSGEVRQWGWEDGRVQNSASLCPLSRWHSCPHSVRDVPVKVQKPWQEAPGTWLGVRRDTGETEASPTATCKPRALGQGQESQRREEGGHGARGSSRRQRRMRTSPSLTQPREGPEQIHENSRDARDALGQSRAGCHDTGEIRSGNAFTSDGKRPGCLSAGEFICWPRH